MPVTVDTSLLQAALIGYESQRQKIQDKIDEIQRQLNGRANRGAPPMAGTPATRRRMSPSARRRIAAAQKKRWAEYRKKQKAA